MAIEIKKQKKNNILLYFVIILLLIMIGWLGWSFFKPSEILKSDIEDLLPSSSQELIGAKLDIGMISNHPVFQTLSPHINWPLDVPDLGRANPFKLF